MQIDRMRGRFTPRQNSGISIGSTVQLCPPSVERSMRAREGAPVPAYRSFSSRGDSASVVTLP